jgi:alanyl-tRNA synthetase
VRTDEIRERYLAFFEERGHKRIPSASLVPSAHDPSALLTVAGMHPLKPYFLGQETPPAPRLTDCQKCFRTIDIANVGNTSRHLTFFEMLGNFSIGAIEGGAGGPQVRRGGPLVSDSYFKAEAIAFAWELSRDVFGFSPQDIWVTVFEGDEALGLGPDQEAIGLWEALGVPSERIVACPRSENFWQAGPSGPCGPCSELYVDRGALADGRSHRSAIGGGAGGPDELPDELPGGENERFLEYWNLVFMQYDQHPAADGTSTLTELPARNIDTGLGLNRMAAILQEKPSVFETDQFQPLIELGEQLSGATYGKDFAADRALRILADHSRAMSFLVADGVVPSNEERGYVLRRVMRRAIQQGRALEMEPGFLLRYADVVRELMAGSYPELVEQRESVEKWLASEEEGFGRTLEQGLTALRFHIDHAREKGHDTIQAEDAFRLHDTFGFPFELTRELLDQEGLSVDDAEFDVLMDQQRARARAAGSAGGDGAQDPRVQARRLAEQVGAPTRFTGYETERQPTTVAAVAAEDGQVLVKLADSPFYAAGGGQVSDAGTIECERGDCRARVQDVYRLGEDQVLSVVLERGELEPSEAVLAQVDHAIRHATQCNHTATHLLHAALRARLGNHVRQAGSYVGPDKLRFDFNHGGALSEEEMREVEDQVNAWIAQADPVHPITTTLDEAKRLGAMALFGEKYGDVVRMVEVGEGEYSRELCGGTHVANTAEIGVFKITRETSSAANVRRLEAITGPAASDLLRDRDRSFEAMAATSRISPERLPEIVNEREMQLRAIEKITGARAEQVPALLGEMHAHGESGGSLALRAGVDVDSLLASVERIDGVPLLATPVSVPDAKALPDLADRLKGKLDGDGVVVLGAAVGERVALLVSVAPSVVQRGVKAGAIVKLAAEVVGGGGGGRDTMAQAGGRDPAKLAAALAAARAAIAQALGA